MERDVDFKKTLTKLSKELPKVKYNNGDISDIRSEERRVGREWSSDVCSSDLAPLSN